LLELTILLGMSLLNYWAAEMSSINSSIGGVQSLRLLLHAAVTSVLLPILLLHGVPVLLTALLLMSELLPVLLTSLNDLMSEQTTVNSAVGSVKAVSGVLEHPYVIYLYAK